MKPLLRAKKVFVLHSKKRYDVFFYLWFLGLLRIVEENYWHISNPEGILRKKHVFFM